jgi:hypothetical protein
MFSESVSATLPLLTPRQDRLEAAVVQALRARGTRNELREAVYQLVDLFRLQRIPPAPGIARITDVAVRAARGSTNTEGAPGDSTIDRLTLIARWATLRYSRGD